MFFLVDMDENCFWSKMNPRKGFVQSAIDNRDTNPIVNIELPLSAIRIGINFKYPLGKV